MAFDDDPELIPDQYLEEYYAMRNTTNRGTEWVQQNEYQEMSLLRDTIRDELVDASLHYHTCICNCIYICIYICIYKKVLACQILSIYILF